MIIKKLLLTIIILLPGCATIDPAPTPAAKVVVFRPCTVTVTTCDNERRSVEDMREAMCQDEENIVMRKAAGQ